MSDMKINIITITGYSCSGKSTLINEIRKHISAYTKNMPEASKFRDEINHITDVDILMKKIQEFFIDIFDK